MQRMYSEWGQPQNLVFIRWNWNWNKNVIFSFDLPLKQWIAFCAEKKDEMGKWLTWH